MSEKKRVSTATEDPTIARCVIEPTIAESALNTCVIERAPVTLGALESLMLFTDAILLFDEVIYPRAEPVEFRYEPPPYTGCITDQLEWDFFDLNQNIRSFGYSPWLVQVLRSRPKEDFRSTILSKGKNIVVSRREKVPHPIVGLEDLNELRYLDKVTSAAAHNQATVIHRHNSAAGLLQKYVHTQPSLAPDLVQQYDQALARRNAISNLSKYRELHCYAPLFLAHALAETADNNPRQVLSVVKQMRDHVTAEYRALCNELLIAKQGEAVGLLEKIEILLSQLGGEGKLIPRVHGPAAQSLISMTKPFSKLLKLMTGDEETLDEIVSSAGEALEGSDEVIDDLQVLGEAEVYRGLTFFNRLHAQRPTSDKFYQDLKRVFGVHFTHEQLDAFLRGTPARQVLKL
ncbi:MAG: hypothetical protein C9356_14930 [Oleiphilus sp.]|nr:MAG: hypothetical protein C9356_14930 [Oleiphilus sp.]